MKKSDYQEYLSKIKDMTPLQKEKALKALNKKTGKEESLEVETLLLQGEEILNNISKTKS
jgi:hypothetical protein